MGNVYLTKGSKFMWGTSTANAALANVTKISCPDSSLGMKDSTTFDDGDIVMKPDGFTEPGKITVDVKFDSAAHGALVDAHLDGTRLHIAVLGPDYTIGGGAVHDAFSFAGIAYVTKIPPMLELKKDSEASIEFTLESKATFSAA